MSISALMNIGNTALSATQTAISTVGNNIANLNTVGYSRQNVLFQDRVALNGRPGTLGQGVLAAEIYRNFNQFLENSYLDRFAQQNRWAEQNTILTTVESVFNEANSEGVSSAMSAFLADWNNLNLRPDDDATRESLLANADTLAMTIVNARQSLEQMQHEMDTYIHQSVQQINELIEGIRQVNMDITVASLPGQNPNQLLDQRDIMVRELAELIDIDVIEREPDFTVVTKSGHTLVMGETGFALSAQANRVENHLKEGSKYNGSMNIIGTDAHEYTFEVLTVPNTGADPDDSSDDESGSMRVSLDGGRTWLRNEDGSEMRIEIPVTGGEPEINVHIKGIAVSFTGDTTRLLAGDRFEVIPKMGVYWVSPTREPVNITPQVLTDGTDNTSRVTGGKLAAYFNVRDENIGRYLNKLDALSNSLVWEVNVLHSQGAGNTFTHTIGSEKADAGGESRPLGSATSGYEFFDRLTSGNISFQIYDINGQPVEKDGVLASPPLDFDMTEPGIQNFDPQKHSLEDLVEAINDQYDNPAQWVDPVSGANYGIHAAIVDGRLELTARGGCSFAVSEDSTGVLAALGVNTFFKGSSASDLAIKEDLMQDSSFINASKVNANGVIHAGDNETALALYDLATRAVNISTIWENTTQSLSGYYGTTVALVGSDTRTARFNANYHTALANDLDEQTASVSGVNLDEEMTSLIKFQHSYTAAAKLITTADEMLQTLLSLKQ